MVQYITNSAEETQKLAQKIAQEHKNGAIIALMGDLGSGKTTFTQGFAQGLGITARLISPTFVLMRQYPLPENPKGMLYHIDLYRLDNIQQIQELGLIEIFSNPSNIILIEWAEKLKDSLPKGTIKISFNRLDENKRQIEVKN